jgi:hypothetical protein
VLCDHRFRLCGESFHLLRCGEPASEGTVVTKLSFNTADGSITLAHALSFQRYRFMVDPPDATPLAFKSTRGSRKGFKGNAV